MLALERGERVLAHASTRGGAHVVATGVALHVPDGGGGFVRVPWERVLGATWSDSWLHVRGDDGEHHVRLDDAGSVPEVVQERVTATVVVSRHFALPGGGVRIVGRRAPRSKPSAARDELLWTLVFDEGLDQDDPGLRAGAEQLLEALRRQTGL
ncbi:hypothetical protein [Actinocorallia longicatena]|uniref:hypothetical protein n=1 Tax=Actinocorallia longicatena TaxID=111803 RepID=UPI0031E0D5C3